MPEPFKNLFNAGMIAEMAGHLARHDAGFDRDGFAARAADGLEALELKARAARITESLDVYLPRDFAAACAVMVAALHPVDDEPQLSAMSMDGRGIRGWAVMPMAEWVALRGTDHFGLAMHTLGEMSKRFSAEFAVRSLLLHDPGRGMAQMTLWSRDPNPHLRRLASEGSRPRLPWGIRLAPFVADPGPVLALLEGLRDDPSDYVRRSVANSLNDIAKDHPDRVAALAADWLRDAGPERRRLVRHACRTLVKQGHAPTLAALGYAPPEIVIERLDVATPLVTFGTALEFTAVLRSTAQEPRELVLDYVIHHRKANGGTSPKVFKWKQARLEPGGVLSLSRRHPMRPITTRVYRDGAHRLEILANGAVLGAADFALTGAGK